MSRGFDYYDDDFKLVWNETHGASLFNLRQDPRELRDIADSKPKRTERMQRRLEEYLSRLPKPLNAGEERGLDSETLDALKGLGYIE